MSEDPTKIELGSEWEQAGWTDPMRRTIFGRTAHGNYRFSMPFMTEVVPGLWQGGIEQGLVLPEFITSVISLYPWARYQSNHEVGSFLEVTMYDSVDQGFEQVDILADWVNLERSRGGQVLVHCQAGLNRSSLVVATALIKNGDVNTGQEAVDMIRKKRSPACLCNPAFEEYVRNLA